MAKVIETVEADTSGAISDLMSAALAAFILFFLFELLTPEKSTNRTYQLLSKTTGKFSVAEITLLSDECSQPIIFDISEFKGASNLKDLPCAGWSSAFDENTNRLSIHDHNNESQYNITLIIDSPDATPPVIKEMIVYADSSEDVTFFVNGSAHYENIDTIRIERDNKIKCGGSHEVAGSAGLFIHALKNIKNSDPDNIHELPNKEHRGFISGMDSSTALHCIRIKHDHERYGLINSCGGKFRKIHVTTYLEDENINSTLTTNGSIVFEYSEGEVEFRNGQ